jgi:hypothetical protein
MEYVTIGSGVVMTMVVAGKGIIKDRKRGNDDVVIKVSCPGIDLCVVYNSRVDLFTLHGSSGRTVCQIIWEM